MDLQPARPQPQCTFGQAPTVIITSNEMCNCPRVAGAAFDIHKLSRQNEQWTDKWTDRWTG